MTIYSPKAHNQHHQSTPKKSGKGFFGIVLDIIRRRHLTPEQRKRFWGTLITFLFASFLAGVFSFIALVAWFAKDIPDPHRLQDRSIAETTKIYDRTGEVVLYEIHGDEKRTRVELADISPYAIHGTIAIEDKDFYSHHGFSIRGIIRALLKDITSGSLAQGGSTITQQFVKNAILTSKKSPIRKLKELVLAIEIERRFTKDEILALYLNEIPYGSVAYGIESASEMFLGKNAKDLTLSEAAFLVSIPQAPTYYSPYGNHREALVTRSHVVINQMLEQGYITKEEAENALKDDVLARVQPKREKIIAPHFVFMVREQLADMFGEQMVEQGGLQVRTTLDAKMQAYADETVRKYASGLSRWNASSMALLSLDPKEGDVLAMVGSADYFDNEIDGKFNILTGLRQPGSSIKPMVYTAAFEKGYTPETVLYDVETEFKNIPADYRPRNYDLKEHGPVMMKEALAGSLNIPAVKTFYLTGLNNTLALASRLGYTTFDPKNIGLSFALGGNEVRPIEHIASFSAYAQEGQLPTTQTILDVKARNGEMLYEVQHEKKEVMDPEIARLTNSVLSNNDLRAYIFGATNYLTLPDRPVAAKTGTTNDNRDAWAIGYTPSLVTGVWVGNPKKGVMKAGADGSIVAAPIWNEYMRKATKSMSVEQFTPPQPILTDKPILQGEKDLRQEYEVDAVTGKLATDATPAEFRVKRKYGIPHSILFFVDRDNPRGPAPTNPESDIQFENWEAGVRDWALRNGFVEQLPPTEFDDVHNTALSPTVTISQPNENALISGRVISPEISATSPRGVARVEYYLDSVLCKSITGQSFNQKFAIPSSIGQGFHVLQVKAFDDVGNVGVAAVTVNVTAAPSASGIDWISPLDGDVLSRSQFPVQVAFVLPVSGVTRMRVFAKSQDGEETVIGSFSTPPLDNFTMQWKMPSTVGVYTLGVRITKNDGNTIEDTVNISVIE